MSEDLVKLDALRDMADGDLEYECEIIEDIIEEGDIVFLEIRELHKKENAVQLGELVHKFKGCLSYVSSDYVVNELHRIENMSRKDKILPKIEEINALESMYTSIKEKLQEYVKTIS
ncbi:MAG: hypothetical protein COB02_02370 [Candidatus Cloacimonadota bacterium]|nr:MAG: hypothetical protein COB02_02370 [Candidatus Cloacimonadota bacterium]